MGHILTPDGLKTNPLGAVKEYPQPQNVLAVLRLVHTIVSLLVIVPLSLNL